MTLSSNIRAMIIKAIEPELSTIGGNFFSALVEIEPIGIDSLPEGRTLVSVDTKLVLCLEEKGRQILIHPLDAVPLEIAQRIFERLDPLLFVLETPVASKKTLTYAQLHRHDTVHASLEFHADQSLSVFALYCSPTMKDFAREFCFALTLKTQWWWSIFFVGVLESTITLFLFDYPEIREALESKAEEVKQLLLSLNDRKDVTWNVRIRFLCDLDDEPRSQKNDLSMVVANPKKTIHEAWEVVTAINHQRYNKLVGH